MLNRVQQARYERQLLNITVENKFNHLSAVHGIKVMSRRQDLLEKYKERVAKENAQRRNLEDVGASFRHLLPICYPYAQLNNGLVPKCPVE